MSARFLARAMLKSFELATRGRSRLFTALVKGAFAEFGRDSVLSYSTRLAGTERVVVGHEVMIGPGSWIQTLSSPTGENETPALYIGDRVATPGQCVLSAVARLVIGEAVLLSKNVYIADHAHRFCEPAQAVRDQGIDAVAPVVIGDGAWLCQNVVVCPGVTIGRGAVVGANSVVRQDVPERCLAAGVPARVIREIG